MLSYYLKLGVRNLRRSPWMTVLVVLTLAAGVSASMSTLTVLHMMSADPIPQKSDRLFTVTIDNDPVSDAGNAGAAADDGPAMLTWTDVRQMRDRMPGLRKSGFYHVGLIAYPDKAGVKNTMLTGAAVDADFLPMMDAPFKYGGPWSKADDEQDSHVIVITDRAAQKLYGDVNPVGQTLQLGDNRFQVIGVLKPWVLLPPFFMASSGSRFQDGEDMFIPLNTAIALQIMVNGSVSCNWDNDPGFDGMLRSECVWLRFWVETQSAADRSKIEQWLHAYTAEQHAAGRLPRPDHSKVYNVREWLAFVGTVDDDTVLQTWLAFGFLLVCLVNTVGLLLAKFSSRVGDIGVRRALGATRSDIALQYLGEVVVIGAIGSLAGLALALLMLKLMGSLNHMGPLAKMDPTMLALTVVLSVAAAVLASVLPIWRACRVMPAVQLKTQ